MSHDDRKWNHYLFNNRCGADLPSENNNETLPQKGQQACTGSRPLSEDTNLFEDYNNYMQAMVRLG